MINTDQKDDVANESSNEVLPVRVIVRARPLLPSELVESSRSCISFPAGSQTLILGKDREFTFDAVYVPSDSQEVIFTEWVSPLVESFFSGYNVTVLAYGQTGAGKTYTMGTGNNAGKPEHELGVVPRVMKEIFKKLNSTAVSEKNVILKASYIEIYNDEIKDLLFPSTQSKAIAIRERADGTIVLAGVKEVVVDNLQHMQQLLEDGSLSRTVAGTLMNTNSSRSHSIFSITIEQRGPADSITAKFHLVDLAGSERAKRTGNVGLRLKESVNINAGLLALGNVISALGDEKKKASHVPYRESKLTRMLQDSLGGNSRTLMIACVSPSDPSFEETLNTLKYANRARNIKNKPIINRNSDEIKLRDISQDESLKLKEEVEEETSWRLQADDLSAQVETLTMRLAKSEASVKRLGDQNFRLMAEKEQALMQAEEARNQLAALTEQLRQLDETKSMGRSLRASLEIVENQLQAYGASQGPTSRTKPTAGNRPSSAPTGEAKGAPPNEEDDEALRELRSKAELAQHELAAKTRELELLEAALAESNARATKSVSDLFGRETGVGSGKLAPPPSQDFEARRVIERHLRIIRRLEDQLHESEQAREALGEQISELREDLARDEEIFSQKQDELQRLSAQVTDLSTQLQLSETRVTELMSRKEEIQPTADLQKQANTPSKCREGNSHTALCSADARSSLVFGTEEGLSVTMQQQANARLASLVDDDDLVQLGDDLLDSIRPSKPPASFQAADGRTILEKGFAALEADKSRLAEEKRALEEEAHALTRRFHMDQHHAEKRVKALEFNMQLKQDLIRNLVRTEQDLQAVNENQKNRIRDLEREIEGIRVERDRTSTGSGSRARVEDLTPENRRIRDQFTSKLRAREAELESLKKQHEESIRILKVNEQKEKRIKALEAEVSKMAHQCDQVKSKAKDEADRFEKMRAEHAAKLRELKAQMEGRVKELEAENERQRQALQRKDDELDGARAALRARAERPGSAGSAGREADGRKAWLDREIGDLLRRQQAVDQLEKELRQREAIVRDKEDAARRRARLQLKKGRREEEVRQSMRGLEDQIASISAQIRSRQEAAESRRAGSGEGREVARTDEENLEVLRCETAALQRQREEATRQRQRLEETLRAGAYLGEEEEAQLADLEERLEGLDMEIEYKGQAIAELQQEVARQGRAPPAGGGPTLEALLGGARLEGLGAEEAREALRACVRRVLDLAAAAAAREAELRALRQREEETMDQLQSLRAAELDSDRRLTQLQREHEDKVRVLLEQVRQQPANFIGGGGGGGSSEAGLAMVGGDAGERERALEEQIALLDKDNFYYKQSCTNLKRRLRELTAAAEQDREVLAAARERVATLEAQLANLKAYVEARGGAAHVRVSRQELRPLTAEDVQALRASRGQL